MKKLDDIRVESHRGLTVAQKAKVKSTYACYCDSGGKIPITSSAENH